MRLKTSLNSLISPRGQALEAPDDPAGRSDRVGDIAEHKLHRREAGVHLAVKFLTVGAAGEADGLWLTILAMDAGGDGKKFGVAVKLAEFVGDAGDPGPAALATPRTPCA